MDLNRFARQLQREVRAHPKRAAFLGLAALVALWFWAPLLLRRAEDIPPAASPKKTTTMGGLALGAQGAATTPVSRQAAHPWDHVARWMDADSRTVVAQQPLARPEPFHPVERDPAQQEAEEKGLALRSTAPTPEEAGLVLSSTAIGPDRRVALISGKAYLEGQSVTITKDKLAITFKLVEIRSRQIVLEQRGRRYEVSIPQQQLSGSIQVTPNTN